MSSGRGEHKTQVAGRGAFARVLVDVSPSDRGCLVTFAQGYSADSHGDMFDDYLRAGIHYAFHSLIGVPGSPSGLNVTVTKVDATVAD